MVAAPLGGLTVEATRVYACPGRAARPLLGARRSIRRRRRRSTRVGPDLLPVSQRSDVGVDGVVGRVGWLAGGDGAFEEGPPRRIAVVAARAEKDRALQLPLAGSCSIVSGREGAGRGIANLEHPGRRAVRRAG